MMVDEIWLDGGGIETLGSLGREFAERTRMPVAFLLNEALSYQECLAGIQAGFNVVMLDTSTWQIGPAMEQVSELVRVAHSQDVAVEAELGHLPDATEQGIDVSLASLTDPEDAASFVNSTGIDCLAVSIGNVHLLTDGLAHIDLTRLAAIHERVSLPLVIHGGTGFPPEAVYIAILCGVAKFNVGTILKKTFFAGIRESVLSIDGSTNIHHVLGSHSERDYLIGGKKSMQAKVQKFLQLYGSSGHAHGM